MHNSALRKVIFPLILLACIFGIALWVLNASRMNEKIPSRGVFVYSKTFYENA